MTNVFFRPWVGKNYGTTGFNGKRILVLGESCYCGECPDCAKDGPQDWWEEEDWKECRDLIPNVVTGFFDYKNGKTPFEPYMRGYSRFTDVFVGHKCTAEETQNFWHSVVLYLYVQTSLEGPRTPPSQEEWATGKKPFFEALAEYNPDVIIVWGKRLWDSMPDNGHWGDESFLNRWGAKLYYYSNGKRDIPAYACYHPSTPAFSSEDTDYFKRLLEKIPGASK
jgi:hypothetical protein